MQALSENWFGTNYHRRCLVLAVCLYNHKVVETAFLYTKYGRARTYVLRLQFIRCCRIRTVTVRTIARPLPNRWQRVVA